MTKAPKKWLPAPPDLIAHFLETLKKLINDGAEIRKMFGYPCSFCQEHMFTGLFQDRWILRLSEDDRQLVIETMNAQPFSPWPGRAMREYVEIPETCMIHRDRFN